MKLNIVPAGAGLKWARQGMRTFWRQPLAMSGLFFIFMATVSLVSVVPFIGGALALVVLPDDLSEPSAEQAEAPSAVPDTSISPLSHGEEPSNP